MRHTFLVVTVTSWLKSVYIYGSYRKSKTGVPLFLDHPIHLMCLVHAPWSVNSIAVATAYVDKSKQSIIRLKTINAKFYSMQVMLSRCVLFPYVLEQTVHECMIKRLNIRRGSRGASTVFRKTGRNEEKNNFFINYLLNEDKTTKKFKR